MIFMTFPNKSNKPEKRNRPIFLRDYLLNRTVCEIDSDCCIPHFITTPLTSFMFIEDKKGLQPEFTINK